MLCARCQLAPENMEQPSRGELKECLLLQAKYFDECWNSRQFRDGRSRRLRIPRWFEEHLARAAGHEDGGCCWWNPEGGQDAVLDTRIEDTISEITRPSIVEHSFLGPAATRRFGLWSGTPLGPHFHVFLSLMLVRFLQCKNYAFFLFPLVQVESFLFWSSPKVSKLLWGLLNLDMLQMCSFMQSKTIK